MYYIYTLNCRILKIVSDTFMYEPVNLPDLKWFRYHKEPPFLGKTDNFRSTFTFRKGYGVSTIPITENEKIQLNHMLQKLEVMEKFNRMTVTYKQIMANEFFDPLVAIILLQEINEFDKTHKLERGSLLEEYFRQTPKLLPESLVGSYFMKFKDMSQCLAFLVRKRHEILSLLKENKIEESLEIIDKELRKLGI